MGFFTIIRSVEALLYEVMTWLVFYPRTLWSVLRHPRRMIDYSDVEQQEGDDEQYTDTLSPPLFLMLTILIAHGIELASVPVVEPGDHVGRLEKLINGSEETLLLMRAIMFSLYPLMFAVALLKRNGTPLDRKTLRPPFYSQCYIGALFAALISAGSIMLRLKSVNVQIAGLALIGTVMLWYIAVQSAWLYDHLPHGWIRSTAVSAWTFLKATLFNFAIAIMLAV